MTPMTLERAVEVAIEACDNWAGFYDGNRDTTTNPNLYYDDCSKAAATLRAFVDKGLPFFKAAETTMVFYHASDTDAALHNLAQMYTAYRAMKEATK